MLLQEAIGAAFFMIIISIFLFVSFFIGFSVIIYQKLLKQEELNVFLRYFLSVFCGLVFSIFTVFLIWLLFDCFVDIKFD
jgi:hypothetical protein